MNPSQGAIRFVKHPRVVSTLDLWLEGWCNKSRGRSHSKLLMMKAFAEALILNRIKVSKHRHRNRSAPCRVTGNL